MKIAKISLSSYANLPLGREVALAIGDDKISVITGVVIANKPKYMPRRVWTYLLGVVLRSRIE